MISEDLMPWFPLMKRRHLNTSAVVYLVSGRLSNRISRILSSRFMSEILTSRSLFETTLEIFEIISEYSCLAARSEQ